MNKFKLLLLSTVAFAVLTLNSCKKDKDNVVISATITAKINGTSTTFSNAVGLTGTVGGQKFTNVQGTASNKALISITINGTITAGKTYTSTAANVSDRALLLYAPTEDGDDYLNFDDDASKLVTVTITAISSTNIQGTFKGNVSNSLNVGNGSSDVKSITEGKFNVNLVSQ